MLESTFLEKLAPEIHQIVSEGKGQILPHEIDFNYDYWTAG